MARPDSTRCRLTPKSPEAIPHRVDTLFGHWQARIEAALARFLPSDQRPPERLHAAMRYSVLGGGKRLRALLVHAAGTAFDAVPEHLDAPASAVEIIHAYSLIHDDLPAMDDDDLRRGKPTCHRAFDEATAILAGDALQALAFEVLVDAPGLSPTQRLLLVKHLAHACGPAGMAGGQAFDLAAVGVALDEAALERMHRYKTGALIEASVLMGAISAGVDRPDTLAALSDYGWKLGLAFQIQDDILDIEGETAIIGKPQGSDARQHKPTYPAIIGLSASRQKAHALAHAAVDALAAVPCRREVLVELARFTVERVW